MSHFRNLFQRPSGHAHIPSATLHTAAPEKVITFANAAPTALADHPHATNTAAPAREEFPTEEARLTPEARLVYFDDPHSPAADRIRLLRMRLKEFWAAGKLKKLLITGPLAHTGKSTLVLNLATALAERGKYSVLVLEADLHHPSIGSILKLKPWSGLTECLMSEAASPLSAIRRIEPLGWYLLPAGEPCGRNPTELLQSNTFGQIVKSLSPYFDWILIDSPPVVPLTDSLLLQSQADASMLVVQAGETPRSAVEQTIGLLGKQNILGIVLNGVQTSNHLYYQYHDGAKR